MPVGPEYVDTVFRVLGENQIQAQARIADREIDKLGPSAARSAAQATSAFDRMGQSIGFIGRAVSGFGVLEIFNRLVGITRQVASAVDNLAQRTENSRRSMDHLSRSAGTLADKFAEGLETGNQFSGQMDSWARTMDGLASSATSAGQAMMNVYRLWTVVAPAGWIADIPGWIERIRDLLGRPAPVPNAPSISLGEAEYLPEQSLRAGDLADLLSGTVSTGATGGGQRPAETMALDETVEYMEGLRDQIGEITNEITNQRIAKIQSIVDAEKEAARATREAIEDVENRNREAMEERIRAVEELREKEREAAEAARLASQERQQQAFQLAGTFTQLGGTIAGVYGQLAASEEAGSKEAERYGKIQGGILAAMSFVNGAIETARAIASAASYDYVAMAEHAAAAAAFFAAGAMAVRDLGGTATAAPAGPRAGTAYAPTTAEGSTDEGGGGGMSIQIYTMGGSSARLGQEIGRANRELARSGIDAPMSGAVQWAS